MMKRMGAEHMMASKGEGELEGAHSARGLGSPNPLGPVKGTLSRV